MSPGKAKILGLLAIKEGPQSDPFIVKPRDSRRYSRSHSQPEASSLAPVNYLFISTTPSKRAARGGGAEGREVRYLPLPHPTGFFVDLKKVGDFPVIQNDP